MVKAGFAPRKRAIVRALGTGPKNTRELAAFARVPRPTITAVISRLVAEGLIERCGTCFTGKPGNPLAVYRFREGPAPVGRKKRVGPSGAEKVLAAIAANPATPDELEIDGMTLSGIQHAIEQLRSKGRIRPTGARRRGRTGRPRKVYEAVA